MYPRQSPTTHTEQLGDEASVYDWARAQVHALNPTAARVWRQCDGATSPAAIAAALRREMGTPEADAVVDLTLRQLARVHLLEPPGESRGDQPATTRRWLLGRGVAAVMLPAIYSIVAPTPVDAQTPGAAPTLASITPPNGDPGSTIDVTLTGTGFGTTVAVSGTGVTPSNLQEISSTSLRVTFTIAANATPGPRNVTVTTPGGTSNALTFTVNSPAPGAPTLTAISPAEGMRGTTVAVTLTGTNFITVGTTVTVSGAGVTVADVMVGSSTSLTANFVLDGAAALGGRSVTVTTAGGTTGAVTFTINAGSMTFPFTGDVQIFTVPPGVTTLTVTAHGAQGGGGGLAVTGGGLGGSVTATLTVAPNAAVNVRVGGQGGNAGSSSSGDGGFNRGGAGGAAIFGGGGGGASDLRIGGDALSNRVLVAGGGGGGASPGDGGAGGGTTGGAGSGVPIDSTGGGGGSQSAGGSGGVNFQNPLLSSGHPGTSGAGGAGGSSEFGGGGGGGGYFGGGGGAGDTGPGCSGGGGGSSFADLASTAGVVHTQGDRTGNGEVLISW